MRLADGWKDYEIIASGNGEKLERWGNIYLLRPEPQAIWQPPFELKSFKGLHAHYFRADNGGGHWDVRGQVPKEWQVSFEDMRLSVRLMGFKHTGVFPEQAANWQLMRSILSARKNAKVLNLFAYTGAASVACALEGAAVCHVDAAKGMVAAARENAAQNNISSIRYIVEDCRRFVEREIRRGKEYDALIMDPPSYGRGASGEVWKLEDNLYEFVQLCAKVMVDKPLFFLINSYTTGLAPSVLRNILELVLPKRGSAYAYELGIPTAQGISLPCGSSGIMIHEDYKEKI